MPCFHPQRAWRVGDSNRVQFFYSRHCTNELKLPCGRCIGCDLARAQEWATRCFHESKMHSRNEFVTLTYDDAHLPARGQLVYEHYQAFIELLRQDERRRAKLENREPQKYRYFGAGEYGGKFMRPHFHACIFGLGLDDRVHWKKSDSGFAIYTSESLAKHWPHGQAFTGDVTHASAGYCARYIMSKQSSTAERYRRVDPDTGEIFYLEPEFNFMSLKPGIGAKWFNKYRGDAWPRDYVIHEGRKLPVPRYYQRLLGDDLASQVELAEVQTLRWAAVAEIEKYPQPSLSSREAVAYAKASKLHRS